LSRFIREFGAISARLRSVSVFNHIAHTARSSLFRHFDPVTEEGEILGPESQQKLGNSLSGERFKAKLNGKDRLLLVPQGHGRAAFWSEGLKAV